MHDFNFRTLLIVLFLSGAVSMGIIWTLAAPKAGEIHSRKKIVPTYQLVVENNKVDTIWIYKK